LAAIYEARGDTEKAIEYYGRFVRLLEQADPEFQPWVDAARGALTRLTDEPRTTQ
jgi:hypothetical protein